MSYPITKVSHSLCNPHGYWPQNGYFGRFKMCFYRILKMNNYPMQIMVDSDTAMMVQSFTDAGISIDFDRLLALMADNAENISDFIQSVEFNEPRMMLPIADSNMKRLVIEQTNKYSISPEQFLKGAVTILYSDSILVTDSMRVH